MATALLSLALDVPVRSDVAMTGELSLMGKVLKVGGIQEKASRESQVIAARRENVSTLLLPRQNEAEFVEIKEYLRAGITAHFVDHFDDVYRYAFEGKEVPPLPFEPRGLSATTIVTPSDVRPPPFTEASAVVARL
ncbi:unnamed protein product [Effrenium voratum]|nr:unnamed protein product [Effrenium voratum]